MACENVDEQCRLCLSSTSPEKCIFTTEDDNKISLATKIMVCTSLVVSSNDDKPQYLCLPCEEILESFFEFRNKCLHSHFQLCFDADVITNRTSPSKDEFGNHSLNDLSLKWNINSKGDSQQLLLVENNTYGDTGQYQNEEMIEKETDNDDCEKSVGEEVKLDENVNDVCFDTSRQFQVGCYTDLDEDLIHNGIEGSSKLYHRFKCISCLVVFSSLENLDNHWNTCTCKANKTEIILDETEETEELSKNTEPFGEIKRVEFTEDIKVCNEKKAEFSENSKEVDKNVKSEFFGNTDESEEVEFNVNTLSNLEKTSQLTSFKRLVLHRKTYLSKQREYPCKDCGEVFNKSVLLRKHTRIHGTERRLCTLCGKSFINGYELKYHMRIHSGIGAYECKECGKKFERPTKLQLHLRTHTGERPYCCQYCEKMFTQLNHVIAHERTHTGERPFKCMYCPKTFKQSSTKCKHEKIHDGGTKMFQCKFCDRMFSTNDELELHLGSHNGELPWKCEICSQCFNKRSLLKSHIHRFHTEDRPFQCELCSKTFITLNNLKAHFKTHVDTKPFQCEYCDVFFKQKGNLMRHIWNLHGNL